MDYSICRSLRRFLLVEIVWEIMQVSCQFLTGLNGYHWMLLHRDSNFYRSNVLCSNILLTGAVRQLLHCIRF